MKERIYTDDDSSLKTLLELNGEIFPMDSEYWTMIEAHRVTPDSTHSDLNFSHGICPDCAEKYYPDLDLYGD